VWQRLKVAVLRGEWPNSVDKGKWAKNLGARSTNFASAPTEFFPPVVFRSETTMQAHTLDFARLVIVNTEIEKVIYTGSVRLYMAHWKLEAK